MTENPLVSSDPERIWLQPKCCAGEYEGRLWCEDNVFDDGECEDGAKATEYVRADTIQSLEAENARLTDILTAITLTNDEWSAEDLRTMASLGVNTEGEDRI